MDELFKDKKDFREFKRWIKTLRSGKFLQGYGRLETITGTGIKEYCCLGVACKILIPKDKIFVTHSNAMSGFDPYDQHESPEWLRKINADFYTKTGNNLMVLNDGGSHTFQEIADYLELIYVYNAITNEDVKIMKEAGII